MTVKVGFKQTEFGEIPANWEMVKVNNITVNHKQGYYTNKGYVENGTYLVRITDLFNPKIKYEEMPMLNISKRDFELFKIQKGDFLFARSGSIGRYGIVYEDADAIFGSFIIRFNFDPKKITNEFFGYAFETKLVLRQLSSITQGSSNININANNIKALTVPLPPLPEQHAIAAALSDVDALLNSLDALIAKKRLIKQGAMQELLTGKRRLPGFSGDWKVKTIGEMTSATAGGTPSTLVASYWGGKIKWMSSGELHLKRVYDVEGRITEEGLKNSSTKIIPPKCVLIGLAGQGITRGTVAINMIELCTNQSIAAIYPSDVFIPEYLYFNLDNRYDELRSISTGDGGRGGLNLTLIKKMEVPLPSLPEQTAIAEILSDMDAEISALEQKREKTRLLKQGMMQELLTGRIRLV